MKRLILILALLLVGSMANIVFADPTPDPGARVTTSDGSNQILHYGDNALVSLAAGTGQSNLYTYYYTNVYGRGKSTSPSLPDGVVQVTTIEQDGKLTEYVPVGSAWIPVPHKGEQDRIRAAIGIAKTWSSASGMWLDANLLVGRDISVVGDEPKRLDTVPSGVVSFGNGAKWSIETSFARLQQSNINWMRMRGRGLMTTFGKGGRWTTDLRGVAEVQNVRLPGGDYNSAWGFGLELVLPNAGDASILVTVDQDDNQDTIVRTEINFFTIRF